MGNKKADGKKLSRRDLFGVTGAASAGLALGTGGYATLRGTADTWDASLGSS
jgi:hypothetical protein